jgi:hypothetical protein
MEVCNDEYRFQATDAELTQCMALLARLTQCVHPLLVLDPRLRALKESVYALHASAEAFTQVRKEREF